MCTACLMWRMPRYRLGFSVAFGIQKTDGDADVQALGRAMAADNAEDAVRPPFLCIVLRYSPHPFWLHVSLFVTCFLLPVPRPTPHERMCA